MILVITNIFYHSLVPSLYRGSTVPLSARALTSLKKLLQRTTFKDYYALIPLSSFVYHLLICTPFLVSVSRFK